MATAETERGLVHSYLEKILASPGFVHNDRLGKFLRFVVERSLNGSASEIKESVLAVEVFGRNADHDSKQDSIVRTEASRLRSRLAEYYLKDGRNDELIIELPKVLRSRFPNIRRTEHFKSA